MPTLMDSHTAAPPISHAAPPPSQSRMTRLGRQFYFFIFVATLALTPLLVYAGWSQGYAQVLAGLVALAALAVIPWRPILGLYIIVACAVVIEQESLVGTPIFTDHLYIFFWPTRLDGIMPERPIGFFMLAVLLILICVRLFSRKRALFGGQLFYPFVAFLACLALGVLHGMTSGGAFRIIILEVRPWWYLFLTYILAYNVVTEVKHVRNILWITILGTAFKGIQGVYIVYTYFGGHINGHNEIMAHEQSFFFVLVLLLLVLFLIHHMQRGMALAILLGAPCLVIALLANNRRADYVGLLVGIGVAWILVIIIKPQTRRALITLLVIVLLLGGAYVYAFRHDTGTIAEPARAVVSVFQPSASDARDLSSNLYRTIEDYDLKYTEAQSPLLGYGFGKPFLQPQVLPNVVDLDPYYLYIPHNNVLWMWMRLGPLGYAALWYLFGSAIVAGCMIARRLKNRELQLFAIFAVATLVMEVVLAYSDYQFFFYRNMIFVGVVMGVLMKLPAIARQTLGETIPELDESVTPDRPKPLRMRRRAIAAAPVPLLPAAFVRADSALPAIETMISRGVESP